MTDLADVATRKAARHVLPIVMIAYFFSFLDRSNMGFAGPKMAQDLHLGPEAYGFALGIFFIGYFICEIPSNLMLEKLGARFWIARIMVTWGLLSAATALAWSEWSLYVFRFTLGMAEAGFFPGIILYLTYWFPQDVRGRMIGRFMVAVPISNAVGASVSGLVLEHMNGLFGIKGWQWVFVIEGLPTCLLGLIVLFVLVDGPRKASWLTREEADALVGRLEEERRRTETARHFTLWEGLSSPRVLALAFIYFGMVSALYGVNLWLPKIVTEFGGLAGCGGKGWWTALATTVAGCNGLTQVQVGLLVAVPAVLSGIGILFWTRHSDVTNERTWHVAGPCFVAALVLLVPALTPNPVAIMIALTIAAVSFTLTTATFWNLPTSLLTGTAAAGGIALINSIGNLGGTAGSNILGLSKGWTGSYGVGMIALGALSASAGATTLYLSRRPVTVGASAAVAQAGQ